MIWWYWVVLGLALTAIELATGPLTPELQKQRDDYVFEKTGRRPVPSGR